MALARSDAASTGEAGDWERARVVDPCWESWLLWPSRPPMKAGIAQNAQARGHSLTRTQPVILQSDCQRCRCGASQNYLPSLCCRLAGCPSPSRGPKRPHRSLVSSWRRSPASSYLICFRGRGVVIYLGPTHGVISQARNDGHVSSAARGRRTGWSGDPLDSSRRLRVCASKRRRARGR